MTTESISELAQATIEVLQRGPKRFKELYPLIAERLPQACPHSRHNGTYAVNAANVSWLEELARVLQEVAVHRGDVWCLKDANSITDAFKPSPSGKRQQSTVTASLDRPRGDSVLPSPEPKASLKLEMGTSEFKAAEHEWRAAAARKAWATIRAKKAARMEQAERDRTASRTRSDQKALANDVNPGLSRQKQRLSDSKEQDSDANEPSQQKHGRGASAGEQTNETQEKSLARRRAPGPPPREGGTPLKRGAALQVMTYPRPKTKAVFVKAASKVGVSVSSFLIRAGLEKIARDQGCDISDLIPESELRLYI